MAINDGVINFLAKQVSRARAMSPYMFFTRFSQFDFGAVMWLFAINNAS
jgi:hypothetical protein